MMVSKWIKAQLIKLPRNREKVCGSLDTFSHKRQLLTTIQPSVSTPPYSLASSAQYFSGTPLFLSSSILPSQEISSHQELSRIFAHKRLMLLISIDSPTYWCDCITNPNNEAPFTQITQIDQHVLTTNSSITHVGKARALIFSNLGLELRSR